MPSSKSYVRNFKQEYKVSQSSEEEKKNRAARNAARRQMEDEGKVKKGDGRDVAHKKALSKGGGNGRSNLKVESRTANRSFSRNSNGSLKSERSRKGK